MTARARILRWVARLVALLTVPVAIALVWKGEELRRLHAVVTLFDEDRIVANFSRMEALFNTAPIPVTRSPVPLPAGPAMPLPAGWEGWLDRRAVTGIVVLKDGRVVHERYRMGTGREDPRISWSVAKSYLSLLTGVVLQQGAIRSLDAPVTDYAPALRGSAYDGVTIRQALQMSSGVQFDEDYFDFWSDINRMGRVLALGGSMDAFAAGQDETLRPPGLRWEYVSIDTHVVGMVLRGATGRSLPDLMGTLILDPLGTHGRPAYVTDGDGIAFALGGLLLTTRDYARMGDMVRQEGMFGGRRIVPADWIRESTAPSAPTAAGEMRYGYQWWIPPDGRGEVLARGVYGQYVYIDRGSGVVIAVNGADRSFRAPGAQDDALAMFRRIARSYEE